MNPRISLIRSTTAQTLELRLPAIVYDDLMRSRAKSLDEDGQHRVSTIVSLTASEYFALCELSTELGISSDELLYCGFRILAASRGDEDVRRDCREMVAAREE